MALEEDVDEAILGFWREASNFARKIVRVPKAPAGFIKCSSGLRATI